jgi:hypothetical protein
MSADAHTRADRSLGSPTAPPRIRRSPLAGDEARVLHGRP